MRLGILIYNMHQGGAERVVSYLLPYFQDLNIEVHLILMNSQINFDVPANLPIHYISDSDPMENGIYKLIKIPYLSYKYAKLIKKLKLTHSLSLLSRPNYINILSKKFTTNNYKVIISERAHPSLQYGYQNLKSAINKLLIRKLFHKADLIICNSHGNANDLIENFNIPKKKTKVIHNPIDLEKINYTDPLENFFCNEYFNLISVARLDEGKNFKLIINAVSDIDDVKLYILGEGPERIELEKIIKEKKLWDKVFLLGFDPEPFKYLKKADLFIFGSNHEGFPNVLLEAMACNLPILSTNCKSGPDEILQLKEALQHDIMLTDYGILVPVNNEQLMKKGIKYLMDSPKYLTECRNNIKNRIKQFERNEILKNYHKYIFQD